MQNPESRFLFAAPIFMRQMRPETAGGVSSAKNAEIKHKQMHRDERHYKAVLRAELTCATHLAPDGGRKM